MHMTEQENALFAQWRANCPRLVADGVVSPADYLTSTPRICVVLKEVNDPEGGGWDLRRYLADEGGRAATWTNVARWVHGIRQLQRGDEELPWAHYERVDASFRKAQLRSICAFNLKKLPGMHTCDPALLEQHAQLDRHYLQAQYALYEPDITLCCGTGDLFAGVVGLPPHWQRTRRGVWWQATAPGKYVVDYAHPAARVGAHMLMYGLMDALREIRANAGAGAQAPTVA